MQIELIKARRDFYLMNKYADSNIIIKLLDAQLLIKRVRPNPVYLVAHNTALQAGAIGKHNLMRDELETFTFSNGSQSLCIDNAIVGPVLKRLLFTFMKNNDFLGSLDTNQFRFPHYDMDYFSLYINGKQISSGSLHMGNGHEKSSLMAYRTIFEGSGICH